MYERSWFQNLEMAAKNDIKNVRIQYFNPKRMFSQHVEFTFVSDTFFSKNRTHVFTRARLQ